VPVSGQTLGVREMSSVHEVIARLRKSATAIPAIDSIYPLDEPTFAPGASSDEIDSLEAMIGSPLPTDYREFLGMCSGLDAMDIWNGYSIHSPALVHQIVAAAEVPTEYENQRLLPVGSDGGGNMFFLSLPSGAMVKWRHDISTAPFVIIAPSFIGFLDRVAQDWSHFINGDSQWEYLAG